METKIDPTAQQLLDALNERSYLVRQKDIARALTPYRDTAIPVLIKRLKHQDDDNYYIQQNALEVLALSADPQAVLPILRHIEIETGWTGHIFDYFRQGLNEKDRDTQMLVNAQLLRYLDEGPRRPAPEPFDPVKSQNDFMDIVSALMEQTGVKELDEESTQLVDELKERWGQPPDLSEYDKNKIPEYQNILVEVMDTLLEFGGFQDSRGELLLSRYIREYGFDSIAAQHALTALARINPALALTHLEAWNSTSPKPDPSLKRVVMHKPNKATDSFDFTLCVREPSDPKWKERPYYFRSENGLIFFMARAEASYCWFVGQAPDSQTAVQMAIRYLERRVQSIDMLNRKQTQTGKYSRTYDPSRYAECVHLIEQHIDLEKWGFEQTHISEKYEYPRERPQVIFDSEWCRVKFTIRSYGEMHDQSDVLSIQYGRRHAPDQEDSILWQGEPHHCWHQVSLALCFLDELPVAEAANVLWEYPKLPEYKILEVPQPVKVVERHAEIWKRYGQRLFELFDLRQSEVWDRFSLYVKQVYQARGWKHYGHAIPHEKIC